MNFLIWRAGAVNSNPTAGSQKDLATRIMDTNPVLEALGNAKSIRNNNSSRFGKYVNLKFSKEWKVMGAEVRTFLLEKSRVTNASLAKERSYHIFYQVLAGSQTEGQGLPYLKGKHPDNFNYTNKSGTNYVDAIDDVNDFKAMDDALESCGLPQQEKVDLYGVVAAMLLLGNVDLAAGANDSIVVAESSKQALKDAEKFLGIGDISELLVEKVVKSPRSNNVYHIALDKHAAENQKDALVKHIYSMMFNVVVERINLKIQVEKDFHKFIGLLDVFGFEVFAVNSFEQLCINYANERLHNFFLMRVFEVEIELYKMQNLQVPVLTYPDNSKVIELLEKSPTGIFPMLDAQCKMPKGSDKNFTAAVCKQHTAHPHFSTLANAKLHMKGVSDDEVFVIHHFAGDVVYTSLSFLDKNTDALSAQFEGELKKSSVVLLQQMVNGVQPGGKDGAAKAGGSTPRGGKGGQVSSRQGGGGGGDTRRGGKEGAAAPKAGSVSKKFLLGLKQLMREIATTHPYFVRCIKPNQTLQPIDFHTSMVLSQMERSGTIECVKLMQAGYPSRAPYADLQTRFKAALPPFMLGLEAHQFVELLLLACNCQPGDYQLGQDMVFFRANKGGVLQELMMMRKDKIASSILQNCKAGGAGSQTPAEFVQQLEDFVAARSAARAAAMLKFQNAVLATVRMSAWVEWGETKLIERNKAALKIEAVRRGRAARIRAENMRKAAKEKKAAEEAARKAAEEAAAAAAAAAAEADAAAAEEAAKKAAELQAAAEKAAAEHKAHEEAAAAAEAEQSAAAARTAAAVKAADEEAAARLAADGAAAVAAKEAEDKEDEPEEEDGEHSKWWAKVQRADNKFWEVHRFLMCKGVEWGFQYHNFYGDWELSSHEPLCNGRPHYVHNTMYGGHAHLFHTIDPHYHVPRWVIGPAPGNENGWAFCESDAATPHEVQATWISWDGFEWHSCKSFRYVPKEDEMDGLDSDEDFMEDDDEWAEGEVFGSLGSLMEGDEGEQKSGGNNIKISLDEYEEMKTNRQHSYEEAAKEKEVVAMESLVEEPETPSVNGGAPASEEPAPEEGGKGGKKKGKSKESKTEEGGTDRASKKKKGGGMFSKNREKK